MMKCNTGYWKKSTLMAKRFRKVKILLVSLFLIGYSLSAQDKFEREHRIKKSQFPKEALKTIVEQANDIKRLRFYREVDTIQKTYMAKFKKSRLSYVMDFTQNGEFRSIGFNVKQIDIPAESFQHMTDYLSENFERYKIRKMMQLYASKESNTMEKTLKNAFQNLMVPDMLYELLVRGKNRKRADYFVIFDAKGNFKQIKKSLPANYDRVLY